MEWFVAYVRSCQEKTVSRRLSSLGVENYVPVRKEWRRWSDRKVLKDKLVLPRMVFVHCDELTRRKLFEEVPYLVSFMMDRSVGRPACIPQRQMDIFRKFVDGCPSDTEVLLREDFVPGEIVKVVDGPLQGVECEVSNVMNRTYIGVRIDMLGTVVAEIDAVHLKKI